MKKFIKNKHFLYTVGIVLLLIIWEVAALIVNDTNFLIPDIGKTFIATGELLKKSYIYTCIGMTMIRMLIGFAISLILALILGLLAGNYKGLQHVLKSPMTAIRSIPTAAIIFALLVFIGAKNAPIIIVVLITFPILYESIVGGMNNIDSSIVDALSLDSGKNSLFGIIKIKLPIAMPYFLVGIASSFAMAFKIEIMAEVIAGSSAPGMGNAIRLATINDPSNITPIFAYSLIVVVVVMILSSLTAILKLKFKTK